MEDKIIYGAIFTKEEQGYSIEVPDIQGAFCASETLKDGIEEVSSLIGAMLYGKKEYPKAKIIDKSTLKENQDVIYLNVYLPYEFSKVKEVYKNKMVTLPVWLEMLAKQKNLNFSKVLVDGLKKELNIK